ncbi:hypothetical protein [Actinomadura sp. 6K520]|uniref:hypothetical protein n=1 Tax=Actinomadura sp. 6K520 TaxID=2530364 RepID=UPI001404CDC7|nr:hypothetical protein [Actinomadura sp. 6K520]
MDMPSWPSDAPKPDRRREVSDRAADTPVEETRENKALERELSQVESAAREACEEVVDKFAETVHRAKKEDAEEIRELETVFREKMAAWEAYEPSAGDASSVFVERAKRSAREDADQHRVRRQERVQSLAGIARRACETLDDQQLSELYGFHQLGLADRRASENKERILRHKKEIKGIFDRGRTSIDLYMGSENRQADADPFAELDARYQRLAEEERLSRRAVDTATPERKDAVLETFGRRIREIFGNRGLEAPPDARPEEKTTPGLVERAKPTIMFRALTCAMDAFEPGLGRLALRIKMVWEAGEALTGKGPTRITIPLEYVGVTVTDAKGNPRLRFDLAFGDIPTIGPEAAPTTSGLDSGASTATGETQLPPGLKRAYFVQEEGSASFSLRRPTEFGVLTKDAHLDVGVVPLSLDTGRWRVAAEPRWRRPDEFEGDRPSRRPSPEPLFPEARAAAADTAGEAWPGTPEAVPESPSARWGVDSADPADPPPPRGPGPGGSAGQGEKPGPVHGAGLRDFADLDPAEFLLVIVYVDMRGLQGFDLAVHGLILAQRALHQHVFSPRRPGSAKTSAQWLRRIGAVMLCDHRLGLAAHIDVDLRTRKPSCRDIGVLVPYTVQSPP